ncbi:MAG: AraC family transcriptional regulator [Eubacteriales bacterium]|nr:AraC family transcriptional regulator [Eubacteriales bacterium]
MSTKKLRIFNLHECNQLNYEIMGQTNGLELNSFQDLLNCEFNLSGIIEEPICAPISSFAQENLLYIQALININGDKDYFTKRYGSLESYMIAYTESGNGFLIYEDKRYELNKGDLFFINCAKDHYYETLGEHWKYRLIHFNGRNAADFYKMYRDNHNSKISLIDDQKFLGLHEKLLITLQTMQPYQELKISSILNQILIDLICKNETDFSGELNSSTMSSIIDYMSENISKTITLDDLSQKFNLSKFYFSREFKKFTGFSPIEYLIQLRIDRAKKLLLSSDQRISEVCSFVGIPDENYFSQLFKSKAGVSPLNYRKLGRKNIKLHNE